MDSNKLVRAIPMRPIMAIKVINCGAVFTQNSRIETKINNKQTITPKELKRKIW